MATAFTAFTSTVAARFLRAGEVVTVGGFMRLTITTVDASFGDGCVRIEGVDAGDRTWVELFTKDQAVEVVDLVAEGEYLTQLTGSQCRT